MLTVQTDYRLPYRVILPTQEQRQAVQQLAAAFVAAEEALPPAERIPFSGEIITLLREAQAAKTGHKAGESQRKQGSEALKAALDEGRELVKKAKLALQLDLDKMPISAQEWGFNVRQTGRNRGHIQMPHELQELLDFFEVYLAKEASRPEGERFQKPSLAAMEAVYEQLQQAYETRESGREARMSNIALSKAMSAELLDKLRVALSYLVVYRYERQVLPELAKWGFTVRLTSSVSEIEAAEEPENVAFSYALETADPDTGVTIQDLTAEPEKTAVAE